MTNRKPLISGNWKMHNNHFEAIKLLQELGYAIEAEDIDAVDVSVHPPFTDLRSVQTVIDADRIPVTLGAQHCHSESSGAFTGEVAPTMLAKLDVAYVIAGHSERRELFGETDDDVNAKVKAILAAGMTPIMCCGETLDEREAGSAEAKITGQVTAGLAGVSAEQVGGMVIASLIYFGVQGEGISLHELLITLFLFITAPVSAHMLAKAALQQKVRLSERTHGKPWEQ